jgi:hypothetical protein
VFGLVSMGIFYKAHYPQAAAIGGLQRFVARLRWRAAVPWHDGKIVHSAYRDDRL